MPFGIHAYVWGARPLPMQGQSVLVVSRVSSSPHARTAHIFVKHSGIYEREMGGGNGGTEPAGSHKTQHKRIENRMGRQRIDVEVDLRGCISEASGDDDDDNDDDDSANEEI